MDETSIKENYRPKKTIRIGTCTMAPVRLLIKQLEAGSRNMYISAEQNNLDKLTEGLEHSVYQYIVMPYKPKEDQGKIALELCRENLCVSLPKHHLLSRGTSVSLTDLNGYNILMMPETGFWEYIIRAKMPKSRFMTQTDRYSYQELLEASVLPVFTTSLTMDEVDQPSDRVLLPIRDREANVVYYAVRKG